VTTFLKVFWPLSIPGVIAGAMLTFLLSLGFYITPALLGGRKETMIAQLIQTEVMNLGAFDVAAAMSWTLMGITLFVLWLYHHFFDLNKLFGGKK
jgi:ABC-type spermidine/putrescine transport system permease subunit I